MNMKTLQLLFTILLALLMTSSLGTAAQRGARKGSPFEALRWNNGEPEVRIEETWYQPVSIHGVAVSDILEYCEKRWPGKREKRFGEDLVEAVEGMGTSLPDRVDLELVRLEDKEPVRLEGVELSERNRNAIRDASGPRSRRPMPSFPRALSPETARSDVEEFRTRLKDQFAYLGRSDLDFDGALDELLESFGDAVDSVELADELQRVLMHYGDGHSGVRSPHAERPSQYPPVLLCEAERGVIAIAPDRSGYLDARRPYVVKIDGRTITEWVDSMSPWIPHGSPQLVRSRALRDLREIVTWREKLGLDRSDEVVYELASKPDAKRGKEMTIALQSRRPTYGPWPREASRVIDDKYGYIRATQMDDDIARMLPVLMKEFEKTEGLIVDVRGNGGGSREFLLALAGYLVGPEDGPWVGNIAAYRDSTRFDEDHLNARFMYREDDERRNDEQREAIAEARKSFEPEWDPGEGFSEWHYLVLDKTGTADEFFYEHPVVILSDAECFSATDIFLGALELHPRVTLMGMSSGGGSARTQRFTLPASGIEVRCASMASFRPNGKLYDGRGVEVDIEVPAAPEDLLTDKGDSVLQAALKQLKKR